MGKELLVFTVEILCIMKVVAPQHNLETDL